MMVMQMVMRPDATLASMTAALEEYFSMAPEAGATKAQLQQHLTQLERELESAEQRASAAGAREAACAHELAVQTQRTQDAESSLHVERQLRQITLQGLLNIQE